MFFFVAICQMTAIRDQKPSSGASRAKWCVTQFKSFWTRDKFRIFKKNIFILNFLTDDSHS